MLYDRWREVAGENRRETALCDQSGRRWTFAELNRMSEVPAEGQGILYADSGSADFVIQVLRAWRAGRALCPLEVGQDAPGVAEPATSIVHLKTTSATMGAARVVGFTAAQLAADAENIVRTMRLRRDWPNLGVISLAHSYGFSSLVTPLLLHGIPLVLAGTFPEAFRAATLEHAALTVPSVPALWRVWHEAGVISSRVRLAISAGAVLPLGLESEIFERTGLKVHNFYGATECGGIAYDVTDVPRLESDYIGIRMSGVKLSIGASGCLEVRGSAVGESYWPEASPALADGCYATSDLVELRGDEVFLQGRAGDLINVAGRKIAPERIEAVLSSHPDVESCLVFGVPSDREERTENIVVCLVSSVSRSSESLRDFLSVRLPSWQVPRDWWFVEDLDVNARGKISRAIWRERYLRRRTEDE